MNNSQIDNSAVDQFAVAMKHKLSEARLKGRSGWQSDRCTDEFLATALVQHMAKGNDGNFQDIANFAMMLHQRGADPALLAEVARRPVAEALALGVAAVNSSKADAIEGMRKLLPELDDALEDLELHGLHSHQGYRKLKDWYRKMALSVKAIDQQD